MSIWQLPEPGQTVIVRGRPFLVNKIQTSALPPSHTSQSLEPQHLLHLSSIEDEGLGEELSVVWELEPGVKVLEKAGLPPLREFDIPRVFDAFLDAVTWGSVSSADDKALQAPFRSGIDIDDYQLDPVVRALSMPRVNLLIADDVGLGKTIEAGLVMQELLLRYRARSILIVCPSSIQVQWKEEMHDKFGLEFRIVDKNLLADLRRRRGIRVNPWSHFPRLITSIDYLKRERPLRLFRETLPAGGKHTYPRPYDLLIVDEAHNVAPSGRGKYATDSQRTAAIRSLTPYFEHKLFLSATPHNGYSESFSALLELLDNQRFARATEINRSQLEAVMVRRMKSELELRWDGSRRFAKRCVNHLEVNYSDEERRCHQVLRRYAELRLAAAASNHEQFAAEFILKLLKKRLFSSPAAFATTIERHAVSVSAGPVTSSGSSWLREIDEAENDWGDDDEYEETSLDAIDVASRHLSASSSEEKKLLSELRQHAVDASSRADSKARLLIRWLSDNLKVDGEWSNERVIIFTEYRATQKWLQNLLAAEGFAEEGRLLTMYGGMALDDRERIKAAFQANPKESTVRILLATDAASEGVNLQNHCCQLIHYEIPWNPNRMEQRNGRVDRHGQKSPEVHVYHFVGAGFDNMKPGPPGELEGDLEFLLRAVLKVETIREDVGKVGPVIAAQVEEAMLGRRHELETSKAERDSERVREVFKFERKLQEQLEKLSNQLRATERDLRLSPENIQNVVEIGLFLAGQPALRAGTEQGTFYVPALTGSWTLCVQGLAHPHTKKIRPIVFDPSIAAGRDDVVLCHLNHRLVQMCQRLLREEVWSQGFTKKINRFTSRMVADPVLKSPAVLIHGRLLVLGGDNHRIHEEIIVAGGQIREGRFSRMNVGDTQAAIAAITNDEAPGFVEDKLKELWPKIDGSVLQSLEARMGDRTKNLQKFLDDRAEREISSITEVMKELARSIRETLRREQDPQLKLDLSGAGKEETNQRERDLFSLAARLDTIPDELGEEIEHLRNRYRDPQPRLFPLAVTFLVPPRAIAALQQGGKR